MSEPGSSGTVRLGTATQGEGRGEALAVSAVLASVLDQNNARGHPAAGSFGRESDEHESIECGGGRVAGGPRGGLYEFAWQLARAGGAGWVAVDRPGVVVERVAVVRPSGDGHAGGAVGGGSRIAPAFPAITNKALLAREETLERVIAAGNEVVNKPYRNGGGHRPFTDGVDSAYDASGAVDWALHGAGLLSEPMMSGDLITAASAGESVTALRPGTGTVDDDLGQCRERVPGDRGRHAVHQRELPRSLRAARQRSALDRGVDLHSGIRSAARPRALIATWP